jgi:1,4-dihydroxy-2-naphthoate polyprenyltransferase
VGETLDIGLFSLAVLAGIFLQVGTNMTNDFFDYQRPDNPGEDEGEWTLEPPQQVLQGAVGFFVVGAMVGLYIAVVAGPLVLLLGAVGIASGYLYSAPPIRLSGTGFGELLAGLNLGLLTTIGAYYVQTGTVDWLVVWVALPVALLMAAVLILNGFRPAKVAGSRSLWARLGQGRGSVAYGIPYLLAYAVLITGVALERLPQVTLLALLGMPLGAVAIASAHLRHFTLAIVSAVGAHLSTTALLSVAFVLYGIFQVNP